MATKPPTQVAGVQGIAAIPVVLTPEPPSRINWTVVFGLPPFQMFAVERAGKSPTEVMAWMKDWAHGHDEQELYDQYCKWHATKGYWKGEDPMGRLIK